MNERIVAEFHDKRLTGEAAMQRFALAENREIERLGFGEFRFVDGVKTYEPVMTLAGWKIVVTSEG